MEELKNGDVPIHCPNSSRWLEIAGGLETPALAEPLLMHAASCETCGPKLKDAVELFSETGSEAEDDFVTRLESSQPAWQADLSKRLASGEKRATSDGALSFKPGRWWFAMNWRFAVLCAIAVLAVVVSLSVHHFLSVYQGNEPPAAPTPQILARVGVPRVSIPTDRPLPTSTSTTQTAQIAYLTLEPGLTRGTGRISALNLTSEIKSVLVTVRFDHPPPKAIHIGLVMNSTQRAVWNGDLELTDQQIRGQQVVFKIPAKTMTRDDYTLSASERTENGTELIERYTYQVNR